MIRLRKTITAEFLEQTEPQLVSLIHERLIEFRKRHLSSTIYRLAISIIKPVTILGVLASLCLIYLGGHLLFAIVSLTFFAIVLVLFWDKDKVEARTVAIGKRYWHWHAAVHAKRMLKVAKRTAPFNAEYDFRGDLLTYYRTTDTRSELGWARRIAGIRYGGNGFVLIYKSAKSFYPNTLILLDSSDVPISYWDEIGVANGHQHANSESGRNG